MLTPNVSSSSKKYGRYILIGTLLGVISMLLVAIRDIGVLGETI